MAVTINDGGLQWKAGVDTSQFEKDIDKIKSEINSVAKNAEDQQSAIDRLARKAATAAAAFLSVQAASGFLRQMVQVRGEFQQLEVAFTTMLGSKERADKLLAEVTEFAATTPYGLDEVAKATKQLLAFGIGADDVKKTLRQLGDVAAGIGAPLGEIAYLYGTIKTAGVALTQDVRQFAQRGIPIYEELAKVLQVNVEEVGNLITAGKVGFPEIQKVFESLTAEGSKFGGLMEAQSKTLTGQISNLQDAVTQMFNELGKGSEGAISTAISGLSFLVENYDKILDIVKLLIAAYGTYRAALILQASIVRVYSVATKELSLAMTAQATVARLLDKSMKALNLTFLKTPLGIVAAGLTALVATMILLRDTTTEVEKKEKLLADVRGEAAKSIAREKTELNSLISVAKNENVSRERRLKAIRDLNSISPQYLGNLTLENIKTQEAKKAIDDYIESLEKVALTKAVESKQVELTQQLIDARLKFDEAQKKARAFATTNPNASEGALLSYSTGLVSAKEEILEIENRMEDLKTLATELIDEGTKPPPVVSRTVKFLDEQIASLKQQQSEQSATSQKYQEFQKQINALEDERKRITGASAAESKAGIKAENERNAIIQKRLDLLKKISEYERNAIQGGLTDDEREIDQINQRFEQQIESLREINKEIDRYNQLNPKTPVALLGETEISRLVAARDVDIANLTYKKDADNYLDAVRRKQDAFDKLRQARETGETLLAESAKQIYEKDLGGFDSYLSYLEAEFDKVFDSLLFDGTDDIGSKNKVTELLRLIQEEKAKIEKEGQDKEQAGFEQTLDRLGTFYRRRQQILKDYSDAEASLEAKRNLLSESEFKDLQRRNQALRDQGLNDLENQVVRESDLYQRLNDDIIRWTEQRVDKEIAELKRILKENKNLTPAFRAEIESRIEALEKLRDSTNKVAIAAAKLSQDLGTVSDSFGQLAGLVDNNLNSKLAEVLTTLQDITSIASKAANAVAQFASGNYVAAAAAVVDTIVSVFSIGQRNREARRRAQQEIADFQSQVLAGEIDVNQLYRQRLVDQAKINKLKVEGLQDEQTQLKKNQEENLKDYERILALIQGESFISGKTTRRRGKRVADELSSLAGLNYDQLEALFLEGRLTDRAKELFESLRKLKEEGLDIDQALADSRLELQELLTGTTTNTLASSIIEGFRAGKRSAAEFADDFQGLMEQALLQSLSYRALEGPLEDFFEQFASDAESGQRLDAGEIERLQAMYNSIINNASEQFNQLQDIAGINFGQSQTGSGNTLTGAIRGITEQQAELLAGQFGGLRVTAAETLTIAKAKLDVLNRIEVNTYRLHEVRDILKRLERDGIKVL